MDIRRKQGDNEKVTDLLGFFKKFGFFSRFSGEPKRVTKLGV